MNDSRTQQGQHAELSDAHKFCGPLDVEEAHSPWLLQRFMDSYMGSVKVLKILKSQGMCKSDLSFWGGGVRRREAWKNKILFIGLSLKRAKDQMEKRKQKGKG